MLRNQETNKQLCVKFWGVDVGMELSGYRNRCLSIFNFKAKLAFKRKFSIFWHFSPKYLTYWRLWKGQVVGETPLRDLTLSSSLPADPWNKIKYQRLKIEEFWKFKEKSITNSIEQIVKILVYLKNGFFFVNLLHYFF